MKVAFLVPSVVNCGPLNVVLNIISSDEFNTFRPLIISIRRSSDITYENIFLKKFNTNILYLEDFSSDVLGVENIIKSYQLDVIHSHGYYPDKILSQVKSSVKKITTIHCMFYKDYPKEYGFFKGFLGSILHFHILKSGLFDNIVGCSESVAKYCLDNNVENVTYLNNGVDQKRFSILTDVEKKKRKSDFGFNGKIYIYAGRFIKRKRVPELIDIFLKNTDDNSLLLLLGEGPEKERCLNISKSNKIKFIGQVDNPEWYYQFSDFVISYSMAEGYPMSIIEAISCGCHALLSDISPHRELIKKLPECANLLDEVSLRHLDRSNVFHPNIYELSAEYMASKYIKLYEDN